MDTLININDYCIQLKVIFLKFHLNCEIISQLTVI